MPAPILSLVVLNWDELERTEHCIASLRANTDVPYELIAVDNGSGPESVQRLEELADTTVAHPDNTGFARGMNSGLRAASGRYVAFINNDTTFPERWASSVLETFSSTSECGIVLPAVTAAGNQAGVRQAPGTGITVFEPFRAIPSGVVYVVERESAETLGGFSELYPLASAEDLDMLFAYWANGRQVVLDERVLVDHESAVSAVKLPDRDERYRANRLIFTDRWSNASPDSIPRLPDCPPDEFAENLERARIAATWIDHWFRTMDRADSAEARLRRLKANQSRPPQSGAARWAKRIRAGIARRLRRVGLRR